MEAYIALIHPPIGGSLYGVTFPDLPGCTSSGTSFEQAVLSAREALSAHLALLRADGDAIPYPRSWQDLQNQALQNDAELAEEIEDAIPQLVAPRLVPAERVRVNITLDKGILRRADEQAEAEGLTRSRLIEEALLTRIGPE
jgi:predicted RNase H-like HicB family nuclease